MRLEDQHRFDVWGAGRDDWGALFLECRHCDWRAEIDTTEEALPLADLIDRADEHSDCRPRP